MKMLVAAGQKRDINVSYTSSFIKVIKNRPKSKISICSFTMGRLEILKTIETWRNQEDECTIIVAEFGVKPILYETLTNKVDVYVFGQSRFAPPFDACWWRNVSCSRAQTKHLICIDGDIATGPSFTKEIFQILNKSHHRFNAVHPIKQMICNSDWSSWKDLRQEDIRYTNESTWIFHTERFKNMGGWPEEWVGGHEATDMNPRIYRNFMVHNLSCENSLCHVRHEGSNNKWQIGGRFGRRTVGDIHKYES